MIRLSACIEMVFADLPFDDRIRKTAQLGIPAIEFWGWTNKDLGRVAELTGELGLAVAAMSSSSTKPHKLAETGGWLGGNNTELCADFIAETIEVGKKLGNPAIIMTSGNALPGVSRAAQRESLTRCLAAAAPVLEKEGFTLVLEPLNELVNHKGIYLVRSDEAFAILDDVGSPNVKLLYDVYHQQISEGNLIDTLTANIGKIGHFHTADVPGRNEPGTGEICYPNVFKAIAATDYPGFVGMEFRLTRPPEEALAHTLKAAKEA